MLSGVNNNMGWMEGKEGEQDEATASWVHNNNNNNNNPIEDNMPSLSSFKSMLDSDDVVDWYNTTACMQTHHQLDFNFTDNENTPNNTTNNNNINNNFLLHNIDSSPSSFNNLHFFLPPKTTIPSFNDNTFDLGSCDKPFLDTQQALSVLTRGGTSTGFGFHDLTSQNPMVTNNITSSFPQFPPCTNLLQTTTGFAFVDNPPPNDNSLFLNRSKLLKPLDNFTSIGSQPTLFQKRAALRKNQANAEMIGQSSNNLVEETTTHDRKRKCDDIEDVSIDGSALNYDSDELVENKGDDSVKNGSSSTVTGVDQKGKKKGLPAKNLMAERRRRKKLNDRLYMLRSVVPKISKMDRASILGDAIEYLKELLQKINDLHNELESTPTNSSLTPTTSFYPLTPTAPSLPGRIKEELCPSSFASPLSSPTGQPARVEVRAREGRAVNIHMFCSRRPGLLLSTMRALDNLGLDIQQAVISCFNGFALDIFRAEQSKEGQDVHPEQIKAVLLESAGFHGVI